MYHIKTLMRKIRYYGPFLGSAIRVTSYNKELTWLRVEMRLTWYNRNVFGVHFGGSLYAMCDPWYATIISHHLGKGYIVWDKAAAIRFIKPGKGTVHAEFKVEKNALESIETDLKTLRKKEYQFLCTVYNGRQQVIAEIEKTIYVRRKPETYSR